MIRDVVHMVHTLRTRRRMGAKNRKHNYVHLVHPALYAEAFGAHGFAYLQTFYSSFSRRGFTGKCTYVYLPDLIPSGTPDSDAVTTTQVTVMIGVMVALFFAALRYIMEVMA